jgi:hypothetical protein
VHDRVLLEIVDAALASVRVPPVCRHEKGPPLTPVAQIGEARRRREDQRTGVEHVRQRTGIVFGIRRNFRKGYMAGSLDEFLELTVCHRGAVNPESVNGHAMDRRLFWIMPVRSHVEGAAWDEDHVGHRVAS